MESDGRQSDCNGCCQIRDYADKKGTEQETDRLLFELVARYVAIVVFNAVVKLATKYRDIESAHEETRRASWEDSMLHVQNMVLDNCLSTIKHETIYYPNKIKQIVGRLNAQNLSETEEREAVETMTELIEYYKGIFTILSSCASRQLEEVTFRRTVIPVQELLDAAGKYFKKLMKNRPERIELEITFVSAEDILMSKVDGEIGDWDGTEVDHTESVILHKYIDVSKLTFEKSNVYKVIHSGKQVAEICKEYLVTPDFSSQAIVAYPMKEDGSVNLSQGIVAQLLGKSGKVNGGSVSWNMEDHSLTYVDGTLLARNNVYVLADGTISLSVAMADDVLSVLALEDVARDVRGGVIHNYPLVKIGTQYWMRSNLEASLYVNGDALPKLNQVTANLAGYLQSTTEHYFYTANVALSGRILPTHWSIPNWEDWNILKDYLKGEASLLKSGIWLSLKTEEQVQPATNLSGFNGIPVGMYVGAFQADY